MDCDRALTMLSSHLDGVLPRADAAELETHLAECGSCQSAFQTERSQDTTLRRAFVPRRQAVQRVADHVIGQMNAARSQPSKARQWFPLVAAAAVGFLIAELAYRPWQSTGVSNPTPSSAMTQEQLTTILAAWQKDQQLQLDQLLTKLQAEQHKQLAVAISEAMKQREPPPVQLTLTTGQVEALPPGVATWRPLRREERVEPGSRVRTAPQARCEFRTADGSEIRLNGGSEVVFHSGRHLALQKGQLWTKVAKDPTPFQVQITDATVTALGTEFDVLCLTAATVLTVLEGTTRVEGKGSEQLIKSGESAKIVDGLVAEKRQRQVHDMVMATRWVHELLVMKGRDNSELSKRVNDLFAQIGEAKTEELSEGEIRALGDHGILPLTRFLQSDRSLGSKNERKRELAGRILADLAQPWSIPDLIGLLDHQEPEVRFYAAKGLVRLTRETQGMSPEDWRNAGAETRRAPYQRWQNWWRTNKSRYPATP